MNYNFGGGGLGGAGAGGFQAGGFQQKQQPAFGAQPSQFTFGKPVAATSGFNTPQQAGAFSLGGQPAATGLGGFGQQIGGFASPSTAFGGPKFGTGVGSGLGVGLGGLGGKTSPSGFNLGGGMGNGFGATSTQQSQPFGGTSAFGTGGGGFGAPQQQLQIGGGMFGGQATGQLGFGQQAGANSLVLGGGAFGGIQQPQQGTGNPPFDPTKIEDIIFDKNRNQRRETFHLQVITGQTAYEGKSQEELRLEDYRKGLRGPSAGGALALSFGGPTGGFGAPATSSPFGQSNIGFGGFGQPTQAAAISTFGGGNMFGAQPAATTNMFGQQQPAQSPFLQLQASPFGSTPQVAPTAFSFGQSTTQPAAGSMFGGPAATSAFGAAPAFGQQPTTGFGGLGGGGFGNLGGFGQPAPTAAMGFGQPAPAAFGGFGAPAASTGGMFGGLSGQTTVSAFGATTPAATSAFSFGQPATQPALGGGMFGAPAATSAFGATSTTPTFGGATAFGQQPAATATSFGGLGGSGFGSLGGFGAPAATSAFGAPTTSAPAFGGFGAAAPAPATATGGGIFGGFGQTAPAAATPGFGGFGGFGSSLQPAKPATGGFSALSTPQTAFGMPLGTLGGGAVPQQSMFGMSAPSLGGLGSGFGQNFGPGFGQQQPLQQQQQQGNSASQVPLGYPSIDLKMELLRSKRDELDVQLKDSLLYGGVSGPDTSANSYNPGTFSVPRSLPTYQRVSRSTAKIAPRGLITSATMGMATTQQRPLSSILSASAAYSNSGANNSSIDLMSPEKLLGRSAKRLIIVSTGGYGSDPTLDLPLPSYQQRQMLTQGGQEQEQEGITPPRALLLDRGNRSNDKIFSLTNANNSGTRTGTGPASGGGGVGDVTGLTPSHNRSPYTVNSGDDNSNRKNRNSNGDDRDNSNNKNMYYSKDRPQSQRLITQRISTPYGSKMVEREKESIDYDIASPKNPSAYPHSYSVTNDDYDTSINSEYSTKMAPVLLRPGYITTPTLSVLQKMTSKELSKVNNFSVCRPNVGKIIWEGETDVRGLDLDLIITIEKRGVEVYDNEESILMKPDVGYGLNKTALIYLKSIFPPDNSSAEKVEQFPEKLKKICLKSGSEFIDYDRHIGEWIFRVEHFSRYGLDDDSDDENDSGNIPKENVKVVPKEVKKLPIVLNTSGTRMSNNTDEKDDINDIDTSSNKTRKTSFLDDNDNYDDGGIMKIQTLKERENDRNEFENAQYTKYSLTLSSNADPSDLKRMRLSFSQPSSRTPRSTSRDNDNEKQNSTGDLVLQSGIFSPRIVKSPTTSTSTSNEAVISELDMAEKSQIFNSGIRLPIIKTNDTKINGNFSVPILPKMQKNCVITNEIMKAIKDTSSHPYHLLNESPCMQILLEVKTDYLYKTGQNQNQLDQKEMYEKMGKKKSPIVTKVSGTGLAVKNVLQRRPVDYSLSMGRSFRVGWGANGEIVHAGKLLFNVEDSDYGTKQRVVIEKINTVNWIESEEKKINKKEKVDSVTDNKIRENSPILEGFQDTLKAVLSNSFVYQNSSMSNADNIHSNNDDNDINNNVSTMHTRTIDTTSNIAPLWRTSYAKPDELNEYIPYLNTLESLIDVYEKKNLNLSHPDWTLFKAIELFHAVNGQEKGSYTIAKSVYSQIGNGNKLHLGNTANNGNEVDSNSLGNKFENPLIEDLNLIKDQLDFLPLFEEREGYLPVDWERRKEAISSWLADITSVEVVNDAGVVDTGTYGQTPETYSRIFELLSCHRINDAIELTEKAGLYRLSTLLNQIGDDNQFINLIYLQLDQWVADGENELEFNTIPEGIIDIYRLLGSDPFPSDNWMNKSILQNIGWKRGLSMIYWYCHVLLSDDGNSIGTLTDSLLLYDDAVARDYIDKPMSPYVNNDYKFGSNVQYPDVTDGLYSLLQLLFRNPQIDEDEIKIKIINSLKIEGYTRDPLDYRCVYIILLLLESSGIIETSSTYSSMIRQHFISQLLFEGYWLWGVFVALQIPDDTLRSVIVRDIILKYAVQNGELPSMERTDLQSKGNHHDLSMLSNLPNDLKGLSIDDEIYFLIDVLHVPKKWLYETAAYRNGYHHNYIKQVQYLNYAELWCEAKRVVCEKLVPYILLKSNSTSTILLELLETMNVEVGQIDEDRHHSKSDIILSFLRLKANVNNIVNKQTKIENNSKINEMNEFQSDPDRNESITGMSNEYDDFQLSMIVENLAETVYNARMLLKRVQLLTTAATTNSIQFFKNGGRKPRKGFLSPSAEYATLQDMGTYLFDLIDRLTWYNSNDNDNNYGIDIDDMNLYESISLFENSLSENFPVQGDHILNNLHHHSSSMLKRSADHFSESYRMSHSAPLMNIE